LESLEWLRNATTFTTLTSRRETGTINSNSVSDVNIWGNRVSPPVVSLSNRAPACGGASRSHQRLGHGETGFPHPLPVGRIWGWRRGVAAPPRPPRKQPVFILALCSAAAWMTDRVNAMAARAKKQSKKVAQRHRELLVRMNGSASSEYQVISQQSRLDIARQLLARLGERALPEAILQLGCEMLGADCGELYLFDRQQGIALVARHSHDEAGCATEALDGVLLTRHTLRSSLPQIVDCAHDSEARLHYCRGGDCRLTLSVPLQWKSQNIAVV